MLSLIATILGFLLPLLDDYLQGRQKGPTYAQDKQKFNQYLVHGDAPGMSALFEQLRTPELDRDSGRPGDNKAP